MGNNVYIFGEIVKDYCKRYENPLAAYHYLWKLLRKGLSDQDAIDKYEEHLNKK